MFKNYFKIAYRNLLRNKTYALINLFGLGISIAAVVLIMLYVRFEFSFDNFHKNEDRLYRISVKTYQEGNLRYDSPIFVPPIGPAMKRDFPEVETYTRFSTDRTSYFYIDKKPIRVSGIIYADSTFFDIFNFEMVSGDRQTALRNPYSIVLTNRTAEKLFGTTDPIGKVVNIDNADDYVVAGIVKTPPANSTVQFNALISFETRYKNPNNFMGWMGGNQYTTYLRLKENARPDYLESKLPGFMWENVNKDLEKYNAKYEPYLQPVRDIHFIETGMTNIYIFGAVGVLILLIASINFINLTTAHYTRRVKEVGVRKVVGADRKTLITQFLTETLLLTFIALIIGLVIALAAAPYYRVLMQREFFALNLFDPLQTAALVGLLFLVGILAGSYPAFYLSSIKAASSLRSDGTKKVGKLSLQNVLIVAQFTISVGLIITTLVVSSQLSFIKNKELGYNKDNILVLSLENESSQLQTVLIKQRLKSIPGIIDISASSQVPSDGFTSNGYVLENSSTSVLINVVDVDHDFLDTYDIKLLDGRNFSKEFSTDREAILVNEALVKSFGWKDPLERKISRNGDHKVIGVVDNFNFASLHKEIAPLIITNKPWGDKFDYLSLRVNTDDYSSLLTALEKEWKSINPTWPFEYNFLDEKIDRVYKLEQNFMKLFFYFSSLAIIIAALGLFSLSSLSTEQRTKEIGIRKVLGASAAGITNLLTKKYLILVAAANLIAWPAAYYLSSKWLEDFAYRINLTPIPFLTAAVIAILITILSVGYRTLKAASMNPVNSIKYE